MKVIKRNSQSCSALLKLKKKLKLLKTKSQQLLVSWCLKGLEMIYIRTCIHTSYIHNFLSSIFEKLV